MTSPSTSLRTVALSLLAVGVVVAGCTTLPTSGSVHLRPPTAASKGAPPITFVPPAPAAGAEPIRIAKGFLLAMQANPLTTAVARSYLTDASRTSWQPNRSTLVYDFATYSQTGDTVTARLADAHRLDSRGGWLPGVPGTAFLLNLPVVKQHGEWRITDPQDALVVPTSYFQSQFVPFNLYFFDQTGRVMVPDQIYVPRGEQTATNLVRGLLAGPGRALSDVVSSAFPLRTDLDLAVGVSDSGVAEVPLTSDILRLPPDQLHRAFVQLAWTLGQVPGITRVRVTVNQAPVSLPDGRSEVTVSEGREFDPELLDAANPLLAIHDGRVWNYSSDPVRSVAGPLGEPGFDLRSLAQNIPGSSLAAVSASGRRVYVAPLSDAGRTGGVRTVSTGDDLLRPCYDMFGDLWTVDRTPSGAQVRVVEHGEVRTVRVPGLTGSNVRAFSVSSDGTRLAAVLGGSATPSLMVAELVRGENGLLRRSSRARDVAVLTPGLGPAVDIGWQSGTTLAILTRSQKNTSQVAFVQVDGSPGSGSPTTSETFDGVGTALVVPPTAQGRLYLLDDRQRLFGLSSSGRWSHSPVAGIVGASYG